MMQGPTRLFLLLGLAALLLGLVFGLTAAHQILMPHLLKSVLGFNQIRPLHVSSVVGWVILTATGGIYLYSMREIGCGQRLKWIPHIHFLLFLLAGIGIYVSYFINDMGGREYLVFNPWLAIPIFGGWITFASWFFLHWSKVRNWPVYVWMWATGIGFMIFHLGEAYLWLVPSIRDLFIRDMTVQWKANGSFVGSWNLLIYGTALYIMSKLKPASNIAHSKTSFFFYFLGLVNLMFGWAHHTYVIPNRTWIRAVAYVISMTEWIVFFNLLRQWLKLKDESVKNRHAMSLRLLKAADIWVLLNLFMALMMSIPAIHLHTHGTYITVAHSMGTTIGINTSILLASLFYIYESTEEKMHVKRLLLGKTGYFVFYAGFTGFWLSLIGAGLYKAVLQSSNPTLPFTLIQEHLKSWYIGMVGFGFILSIGLSFLCGPLIRSLLGSLRGKSVEADLS